jgi:hypothetical protein
MDNLVKKEIDRLASTENPNRGAWLSEMLSVKLRNALENNTVNSAKNLAELDHAIWKWYDNEFGEV